jgi:hypothetical protein
MRLLDIADPMIPSPIMPIAFDSMETPSYLSQRLDGEG